MNNIVDIASIENIEDYVLVFDFLSEILKGKQKDNQNAKISFDYTFDSSSVFYFIKRNHAFSLKMQIILAIDEYISLIDQQTASINIEFLSTNNLTSTANSADVSDQDQHLNTSIDQQKTLNANLFAHKLTAQKIILTCSINEPPVTKFEHNNAHLSSNGDIIVNKIDKQIDVDECVLFSCFVCKIDSCTIEEIVILTNSMASSSNYNLFIDKISRNNHNISIQLLQITQWGKITQLIKNSKTVLNFNKYQNKSKHNAANIFEFVNTNRSIKGIHKQALDANNVIQKNINGTSQHKVSDKHAALDLVDNKTNIEKTENTIVAEMLLDNNTYPLKIYIVDVDAISIEMIDQIIEKIIYIEKKLIKNNQLDIFLVTNNYNYCELINICCKWNVKIIPRQLLMYISISNIYFNNKPSAPYAWSDYYVDQSLDIDLVILHNRKGRGNRFYDSVNQNKKTHVWYNPAEFLSKANLYSRNTEVVLDDSFHECGVDRNLFSFLLHDLGFTNIKYTKENTKENAQQLVEQKEFGYFDDKQNNKQTDKHQPTNQQLDSQPTNQLIVSVNNQPHINQVMDYANKDREIINAIAHYTDEAIHKIRGSVAAMNIWLGSIRKHSNIKLQDIKDVDECNKAFCEITSLVEDILRISTSLNYSFTNIVKNISLFINLSNFHDLNIEEEMPICNLQESFMAKKLCAILKKHTDNYQSIIQINIKEYFSYLGNVIVLDTVIKNIFDYIVNYNNYDAKHNHATQLLISSDTIEDESEYHGNMHCLYINSNSGCYNHSLVNKINSINHLVASVHLDDVDYSWFAFCRRIIGVTGGKISVALTSDNNISFIIYLLPVDAIFKK